MTDPFLTRRQFGRHLTGIVVAFSLAPEIVCAADAGQPGSPSAAPIFAARLQIDPAGGITVFAGKVELGVPAETLKVAGGEVYAADGRRLSYGRIAESEPLERRATAKATPKPATAHTVVGTAVARLDIPAKIMGKPAFVQDLRLPGMVFGRIVRPPGPRARLQEVDIAAVQRMPGVLKVVRDGSFLGVAAEREEQAIAACEALRRNATWTLAEDLPESAKIHAWLQAQPSLDEVVSARKAAVATPIVRQLECSGCATMNSPGSLTARRWLSGWAPAWRPTAESPPGGTNCGVTDTAPGRVGRAAPTCWPPGTWPNRLRRPRSGAVHSRPGPKTAMPCRCMSLQSRR